MKFYTSLGNSRDVAVDTTDKNYFIKILDSTGAPHVLPTGREPLTKRIPYSHEAIAGLRHTLLNRIKFNLDNVRTFYKLECINSLVKSLNESRPIEISDGMPQVVPFHTYHLPSPDSRRPRTREQIKITRDQQEAILENTTDEDILEMVFYTRRQLAVESPFRLLSPVPLDHTPTAAFQVPLPAEFRRVYPTLRQGWSLFRMTVMHTLDVEVLAKLANRLQKYDLPHPDFLCVPVIEPCLYTAIFRTYQIPHLPSPTATSSSSSSSDSSLPLKKRKIES